MPRAEVPLALLSFKIGVEVGQLAVVFLILLLVLLLVRALRTLEFHWRRSVELALGCAIGSLGAFWQHPTRLDDVLGAYPT